MTDSPDHATRAVSSRPGEWVAMHIYYAANPQPLLTDGVRQVFAELRRRDLVDRCFYLNYWLEGPHVRMRFKPRTAADEAECRAVAEDIIRDYVKRRPALYEVDSGFLGDLYDQLFKMEFTDEEKKQYTAADGSMNIRPNNEFAYLPYEPEFGKYGGAAGVELAEWHFEHSSDLTIEVMRSRNLHLRGVLLGTSAQLMMVMSACFLPDRSELADFLARYHDFWQSHYDGTGFIADKEYEDGFLSGRDSIGAQFTAIRAAIADGDLDRLPETLAGWARHCLDLRARVVELAEQGRLTFSTWDKSGSLPVENAAQALVILLSPYLHMTNNRLHVTIRDEAYLAHLLARCLQAAGDADAA